MVADDDSTGTVSDDDRQLFRETVGAVRPLSSDRLHLTPSRKPSARRPKPTADDPFNRDSPVPNAVGMEQPLAYLGPGLQKKVLRRLRQGFFGIDAELDLHGLNAHEARRLLVRFLDRCASDGLRCVHIIHGKGYRSADNQPVLKNKLNGWLRQHRDVLAFCSAPPAEGGTGALFVLLRSS